MSASPQGAAQRQSQQPQPYYIYLTNSVLDVNLQRYITAYVEHCAAVLEDGDDAASASASASTSTSTSTSTSAAGAGARGGVSVPPRVSSSSPPSRVVTFIPERNGILLFGFQAETVRVIYRLLKKLDEERVNLRFDVNLVLVESHKMTGDFEF